MALPRRCPLCAVGYGRDRGCTQLHAEPGGTPSRRHLGAAGRLLILRCRACRGEYFWDYFGNRVPTPEPRTDPGVVAGVYELPARPMGRWEEL